MPKISVIVPVYNVEMYIQQCIDSIVNQTFTDFELILVDDGSTDSSGTICDNYCTNDNRIRVIHQKNQGQSYARNEAIAIAKGDFFCFVDADDVIHPQMLEILSSNITDSNIDMVISKTIEDEKIGSNFYYSIKDYSTRTITINEQSVYELYDEPYICWCVWSKLINANIVKSNMFSVGRYYEDNEVVPKWICNAKKIILVDATMYFYRINPNGTTKGVWTTKHTFDYLWALEQISAFYRTVNMQTLYEKFSRLFIYQLYKDYNNITTSNHVNEILNFNIKWWKNNLPFLSKIAVIVPVFNVETYLARCIDSILNQTFLFFEIILVDDGSEDSSGAICEEYAKKDGRITVIHKENGGLSSARNAGIDWVLTNSNSEYIAFVDSDDWLHENYLEKLYTTITETNADLAITDFMYHINNEIVFARYEHEKKLGFENKTFDTAGMMDFLLHNWKVVVAWNKLYKKEIFKNLRFPLGKTHEDEFLIHHIIHECKTITTISDTLYYYRIREGSIMSTEGFSGRLDAFEAIIERLEFLDKHAYAYENIYIDHLLYMRSIYTSCKDKNLKKRYWQLVMRYKKFYFKHTNGIKKYLIIYINPSVIKTIKKCAKKILGDTLASKIKGLLIRK